MKLGQLIALQAGGPGSGTYPRIHTRPDPEHLKTGLRIAYNKITHKDASGRHLVSENGAMWRSPTRSEHFDIVKYKAGQIKSAAVVKKCPFCGTTNNIKIRNSNAVKCKNCDKNYEIAAGGPGSGPRPAQRLSYSEFKKFPGERQLDFAPHHMRSLVRNNPGKKFWVVYSLGSSFHDPQEMFKIAVGHKVPDGIQEVTTALEYRKAWRHIQDERNAAFQYSRRSGL